MRMGWSSESQHSGEIGTSKVYRLLPKTARLRRLITDNQLTHGRRAPLRDVGDTSCECRRSQDDGGDTSSNKGRMLGDNGTLRCDVYHGMRFMRFIRPDSKHEYHFR